MRSTPDDIPFPDDPGSSMPTLLLIEVLATIEGCRRLLQQCQLDLGALEQRLQGIQQQSMRLPEEGMPLPANVRLSPREQEVLRLVARGLSNEQIGEALGIRAGTVKNHMTAILGKLEARSRWEALMRAQALGLV